MGPSDEVAGKEEVISYERLYRLWEGANWSATAIDFTTDREHWQSKLTDIQRDAALWSYAMFLVGEEAVARTLTPVLDAAEGHQERLFLTTQIVDEARHHVFFDRFVREVAGKGNDTESTLGVSSRYLTWGFEQVFAELDRLSDTLRKKPKDKPLLAQVVALYHVIIEGVLAVPGQHFIQRYVEKYDIMPGFAQGITNVSRDESRHVAFGIKFLGDLVRSSAECRAAAIELWERAMDWAVAVFDPPGHNRAYAECFGFTLEEIYAFGFRSLETKLRRVGIDPSEIRQLRLSDLSRTYEERAALTLTLLFDDILGDDRKEPRVSEQSFEILFDGMTRSMDLEVARSLGGPIEWEFNDAAPWHIVTTNGHAEAKPGRAGDPVLRLESSAADWARIAAGRMDPRWALLKRRLKLHGSLGAKAKLPKLFI